MILFIPRCNRSQLAWASCRALIERGDGPAGSVSRLVQMTLSAAQTAHLESLSSDLRFHLEQAEVSSANQARLGELGVKSIVLFAGLDETRELVREALKKDLPLDYASSVPNRLEMAKLISVWEAARLHLEVNEKNRAEARLGTQQRLVQPNEQHSMRVAVEAVLGKLRDKEVPSRSMLATKLEQIETNQPVVENMTEVASLEDSELEAYSAVIDSTTNVLKIKPGKTLTGVPQSPEKLRLRHRRIGLAWDFLGTKHSMRSWLSKGMTDVMRRFSDYILGPQVSGLQAGETRRPSWALVLQFEYEARKAAYKWLRDGEVATLEAAFSKAMTDTEVLQRHLVIPFSLNMNIGQAWVESAPSGKGKGKQGRARGRGRGVQSIYKEGKPFSETFILKGKAMKTPEGKAICWKYNRKDGCKNSNCPFAHQCQRCMGKHPYYSCPQVKRTTGEAGEASSAAN